MKQCLVILLFLIGIIILAACNLRGEEAPVQTPTSGFETEVAMTLTALGKQHQETPSRASTISATAATSQPTITFTPTFTPIPSLTFTDTKTQVPSQTQAGSSTPIPKPGTIDGSISGYPYGALPSLAIVAFQQEAPFNWSYWITAVGDASYSLTSQYVLSGKWQVVAYDAGGNSGGCQSLVTVKSEETVSCDITDWSSSFPAKPAAVPGP